MARNDTFFLRTKITSSASSYVSDNIDISAYTDPARGRVLVVDRAFITFSNDGQGPIVPADIGVDLTRSMGVQCCSEKQTALVEMSNNSLFARSNLYATADNTSGVNLITMIEQTDSLNPVEFTGGFIIPTDAIHVGLDTTGDWGGELDVGFMFEVHTEKLSLQRIQELLVSLTAN
jgi:hypothetical protein